MNIVHLMHVSLFTENFIDFVEKNDSNNIHSYIIRSKDNLELGRSDKFSYFNYDLMDSIRYIWKIICAFRHADKVYLHSFQDPRLLFILPFVFFNLNKNYWIMWGGDIYGLTDLSFIHRRVKIFLIKRFGGIVALIDDDATYFKKYIGLQKAQVAESCMVYLSSILKKGKVKVKNKELELKLKSSQVNILVGNSANPSMDHLNVFKALKTARSNSNRQYHVYCILSYSGNQSYIESVKALGYELFPNAFTPINNFMPINEYCYFLDKMTIAIFAVSSRQQGLGNIFTMLENGTTLYLHGNTSTAKWLDKNNISYMRYEEEKLLTELTELTKEEKKKNIDFFTRFNTTENHLCELQRLFKC